MKLLLLDLESGPHTAFVWGTWQQNVSVSQLKQHGRTLCWAAKWFGDKKIYFRDERAGREKMVEEIHRLLSEADAVITYNGMSFDIPMLNNEFLAQGLPPIPPQKHIDLYRVARSRFRLASNKLEHVAQYLSLGRKVEHKGFGLWLGCLAGNKADWKVMKEYNIHDVVLLEKVYLKLRPWVRNHPDVDADSREAHCGACGSTNVQHRGYRRTKASKIERLACQDCGAWTDGASVRVTK